MITLDKKSLAKKFKKLISSDSTLSVEEKDLILDVLNKLSIDSYDKRFVLRLQIHEVEILLRSPEHIQAKRGFVSMIKLLGKRNEVIGIFNHIPKRR